MSRCPKYKSSKATRENRRAYWKMTAPILVKRSNCGALMMPHRVCKACGVIYLANLRRCNYVHLSKK